MHKTGGDLDEENISFAIANDFFDWHLMLRSYGIEYPFSDL